MRPAARCQARWRVQRRACGRQRTRRGLPRAVAAADLLRQVVDRACRSTGSSTRRSATSAIAAGSTRATARWSAPSSASRCAAAARSTLALERCSTSRCRADAGALDAILHVGAAQILFLDVPDHAAVDLAVDAGADGRPRTGARAASSTPCCAASRASSAEIHRRRLAPAARNIAGLAVARWTAAYGAEAAAQHRRRASRREPPLDLTVQGATPSAWAERLGGIALPTGIDPARGARRDRRPARLRGGRVVGAGRRRRAAGAAPRRRRRQARRRSLRRAGRQDRAARRGGRARHRASTSRRAASSGFRRI